MEAGFVEHVWSIEEIVDLLSSDEDEDLRDGISHRRSHHSDAPSHGRP
jgi:hypothetical protein